ncbi:MAG: ester cyclase [Anaerolineae bacterium]|nr:ester cyclase [Anaerolineae bacterium]
MRLSKIGKLSSWLLVLMCVMGYATMVIAQQSPEEINRDVYLRIVREGFEGGNPEVLRELYASGFAAHTPNGEGNLEASIATISGIVAAMPDVTMTEELLIASGDYVFGRFIFEGTFTNPLMTPTGEIPPTGQTVRYVIESTHRFNEDHLSVEEWLLWDNLSLLTQLGVLPAPGGEMQTAEDPESIIRLFYQFNNAHDTESQNALWAEEASLTLPDGSVFQGKTEVLSFNPGHSQIEISDVVVNGNTVQWVSNTGGGASYHLEAVVEDGLIQAMTINP